MMSGLLGLATRMVRETDPRLLWHFAVTFGWNGYRAVERFKARLRRGVHYPAFLFISVTDRCNLRCQGCWVTPCTPPRQLSVDDLERIVRPAKAQGCRFYGILGGEPLLHQGLFDFIANHPDCYFQIFTNGTLLTDDAAARMRHLGNVTPLVSIEGKAEVSDQRRGGSNVYQRALDGLDACRRHRLVIGVATSVCKSNLDDLVSEAFVADLIARGVHYLWYYIYRPVGPDPNPDLALSEEEILQVRRFIVEQRCRAPLLLVDAYWDHLGRALCPAAIGISHHVGPGGDLEPCPPIQFAAENLLTADDPVAAIRESTFLDAFRRRCSEATRGCILLEQPHVLAEVARQHRARDTSGRQCGLDEIAAMTERPGHDLPGREIPEKHPFYRFAKKHWFFGFGAYG